MQRICPAKEPCDTNNFSLRTARAWEYRLICRIWCDAPVWSGGSVPIASWSRGFSLGMLIIGRRARVLHPPTDKENSSGSTLLYSAQSWARFCYQRRERPFLAAVRPRKGALFVVRDYISNPDCHRPGGCERTRANQPRVVEPRLQPRYEGFACSTGVPPVNEFDTQVSVEVDNGISSETCVPRQRNRLPDLLQTFSSLRSRRRGRRQSWY